MLQHPTAKFWKQSPCHRITGTRNRTAQYWNQSIRGGLRKFEESHQWERVILWDRDHYDTATVQKAVRGKRSRNGGVNHDDGNENEEGDLNPSK